MTFQKKLTSVFSNFSTFSEVHICTCPTSFHSYRGKSPTTLIFGIFFRKSQLGMYFIRGTPDFRIFSMLKELKFLNCDFWPRKCLKWPNLVPGAIKNMF